MSNYKDIDQIIIDTIEEIRPLSSKITDTNLEVNVPTIVNKFKYTRKKSYDTLHQVLENNFSLQDCTLLLTFDIPFTSSRYRISYMDSLDILVKKGYVYPFLFFVNNKFVKWSDIYIIRESRYNYILINNIYAVEDNYKMIMLPKNVDYNEVGHINDKTLFAFKNGLLYEDLTQSNENCITIDNIGYDNMYYSNITLQNNKLQLFNLNPQYEMNENNIIIFKDGKLYRNNFEYHGLNMFSIDGNILDEGDYKAKGFYYYKANKKLNNTNVMMTYEMVQNKSVSANKLVSYYNLFKDKFNIEFSLNKTYNQNISNALTYIMNYNSGLMNRYYEKVNKAISRVYSGKQLKSISKNGYITMSRRMNQINNNYVMIFVNGKLYSNYYELKYDNKNFTFPIYDTLLDDDIVEILFFLDVDNRHFPLVLSSKREDTYFIDDSIEKDHLKLFTQQPYALDFHIEVSPNKQYDVDFEYKENEDGTIFLYPKNSFYYDKRITMTSERQFRYCRYNPKFEVIDFALPSDDFRFCTNPDQYVVFINGKKIPSSNFEIITPQADTPFDDYSIYFNTPISNRDIMEIFYLPDKLSEMYEETNMTLDPSGNIYLDKTKLTHNIDKNLDFIFVNGKKVPSDSIYEVSQTLVKITTDVKSLKNLSIVQHIEYNDLLYRIFRRTKDKLTTIIDSLSNSERSDILIDTTITDEEEDITKNNISMKTIAYSIMKDYYCAPFINVGENFAFRNLDDFFDERDPEGTLMLDQFNGDRKNKPLRGRDDGEYEEIHR